MFAVAALMTGSALERKMELISGNSTEFQSDAQQAKNAELAIRLVATLTFTVGSVMVS